MKLYSLIIAAFLFTSVAFAQEKVVEAEFKVEGICSMCKSRVEKAVKVKEVKFAKWNKSNKTLKVAFDSSKITADSLMQRAALAGHDTEKYKATAENYAKLPDCCLYRDGQATH